MLEGEHDIRDFLVNSMENYKYYSEERVNLIFENVYNELNTFFTDNKFILAPIIDVHNIGVSKSSHFFTNLFINVNRIPSNNVFDVLYDIDTFGQKQLIRENSRKKEYEKIENARKNNDGILLIDDYSGSGTTIIGYLKEIDCRFRNKIVIIYVVHILKFAVEKIKIEIKNNFKNNKYYLKYFTCSEGFVAPKNCNMEEFEKK